MEDEDFGFTRRDERVLRKVLGDRCEGGDRGPPPSSTPDVGTAARAGSTGESEHGSVANDRPYIPNVVEYHLKVKPRPVQRVSCSETKKDNPVEMKKEKLTNSNNNNNNSCSNEKKDLLLKLSRLSIDNNVYEGSTDLPQVFQVKYLGSHDARGLWGIKHTRRPVDNMVSAAKALPTDTMLPLTKLVVSRDGVALLPFDKKRQHDVESLRMYPIETISYGVQDLVYTRVFSMIVVRETENFRRLSPFECHGFVCESKHHARQLTYALATAFDIYSRMVKARDEDRQQRIEENERIRKRFAIDLRSPDEIEADLNLDSEA